LPQPPPNPTSNFPFFSARRQDFSTPSSFLKGGNIPLLSENKRVGPLDWFGLGCFPLRERGREREGGIKGGRVRGGGVGAEGFQRGDVSWCLFLSVSISQTGVSGASPVVIGFRPVQTRSKPVIGGLLFQGLVFQVFNVFKVLEFREWVKKVNRA
jgi:hypothetical protein